MRKLSVFITADALLAAVLLVWAQLWIQPYAQIWGDWYAAWQSDPTKSEQIMTLFDRLGPNINIGLAWTYLAVLCALMALVWIGCKSFKYGIEFTPNFSLGLFFASITLAILEVGQSFVSIVIKTFDVNSKLFQVTTRVPIYLAIGLYIIAILIIVCTTLGTCISRQSRFRIVPWIVYGLLVSGGTVWVIVTLVHLAYFS